MRRLAGQGTFDRDTHKIVSMSAVWIHVGLNDAQARVEKAREAFQKIRDSRNLGTVAIEEVEIKGHKGTTSIFSENNRDVARLTEYENDGHSISGFPFDDPNVLRWLFEQRSR